MKAQDAAPGHARACLLQLRDRGPAQGLAALLDVSSTPPLGERFVTLASRRRYARAEGKSVSPASFLPRCCVMKCSPLAGARAPRRASLPALELAMDKSSTCGARVATEGLTATNALQCGPSPRLEHRSGSARCARVSATLAWATIS